MQWQWIDKQQQLDDYCQRCMTLDFIAVDTEFVRTRTFYPNPGLVQIYDGKDIVLVDPLAVEDWSSFQKLMASDVVKVFHACGEDLELLRHCLGCDLNKVFDTQLAWALSGKEVSISFQRLVATLQNIELDKSATRTDWCARPLSEKQLDYAAADVFYLYPIYRQLAEELEKLGRLDWQYQEMQWLWSTSEPVDVDKAYLSVNGIGRLDERALSVAWYLARWREQTCREKNLARPFVLHDAALLELSEAGACQVPSLSQIRQLKPQQKRKWGEDILACIELAHYQPHKPEAVKKLSRQQQKELKQLKQAIELQAKSLKLEPALLCSKRDLTRVMLEGQLPEKLCSWRAPLVTDALSAYLKG